MTATEHDRDIRLTRVYDAPLALVWEVFTVDAHVAQWWGPRGFSITTHSKELRPGGFWDDTMHGPDGVDYPNFTRYLEVVPQSRLVYDHGASSADSAPMFRVTAQFRDLDGQTELTIRMTLPTAEAARQARGFIKAAGGNATWDRLAEYLTKHRTRDHIFVITRSFEAPSDRLFDLFATPAHLARWLPPAGFTMVFQRAGAATHPAHARGLRVRRCERDARHLALLHRRRGHGPRACRVRGRARRHDAGVDRFVRQARRTRRHDQLAGVPAGPARRSRRAAPAVGLVEGGQDHLDRSIAVARAPAPQLVVEGERAGVSASRGDLPKTLLC